MVVPDNRQLVTNGCTRQQTASYKWLYQTTDSQLEAHTQDNTQVTRDNDVRQQRQLKVDKLT